MSDDLEPKIMFNGTLIPTHEAWKKMETATVAAEILERFNQTFPKLATDETRATVPLVRKRLKEVEVQLPKRPAQADQIAERALDLLKTTPPEDVLEMLKTEFATELDLQQLLALTGKEAYLASVTNEAHELTSNMISPEQMAELWNDARRPAPGGGLWTGFKVKRLMEDGY